MGVKLIDATCPHVRKAQQLIEDKTACGYTGIVLGDKNHAEIIGIVGHSRGKCIVIESIEETSKVDPADAPFVVICQTTFNIMEIDILLASLPLNFERDIIVRTVCQATQERQEAAMKIAKQADVVFVIGGYHSANTRRLAKICGSINPRTYHVETASEITPDMVEDAETAGVTAGASTPDWLINEVCKKLKGY